MMKIAAITNSNIQFQAKKISPKEAKFLERELKKANSIDIITHESTDRDGANSALAMSKYLENLGVQSRIIISQKDPESLGLKTQGQNIVQACEIEDLNKSKADAILCVDFSAKTRVNKKVLDYINSADRVFCLDHHKGADIRDFSNQMNQKLSSVYIDTTAKSATAVIYRYFEALGRDFDDITAYNLFCGFADDSQKRGYVICDGEKGKISASKKLKDNAESYEVYKNLSKRLTKDEKAQIAKNIDIMASLSDKEKEFKASLYDRLKLSKNGSIAYVEIPPDDKQWLSLGMDNPRTSTILNRFRQEVLSSDKEELKNVKAVIAFYRAGNVYRMSAHSKDGSLLKFFNYVEQNKIPNLTENAGGHSSRAGGKTFTTNKQACSEWVQNIISCDSFYEQQ